jgi:hypothetical protein
MNSVDFEYNIKLMTNDQFQANVNNATSIQEFSVYFLS